MEGDRSNTLREPTTFHQKHRAVDGIDMTMLSARLDIGDKKVIALRNMLENDLQAADVKWSLFVAACQSYRYDSCLKPFPPQFILNDVKDIDSLREVVDKTPSLILLTQHLYDSDAYQTSPQVIDLLYWVLVHLKDVRMQSVPKSEFESVLQCVHCETAAPAPDLIFQLVRSPHGKNEMRWQNVSKGHNTLFAFHGSRLDNFHSILHYGLQQHLNKNSLFGRGIYLSSELSVSLPYSSMGYSWGRSVVGSDLSCVALCEVVDHPDVKCQDSGKARSLAKDSIGGEVPQKYYVVMNSDLVKVRYLLVYSKFTPRSDAAANGTWIGWLRQHKVLTFLFGYVLLLALIGFSNNRTVQRYYHLILKRVGL